MNPDNISGDAMSAANVGAADKSGKSLGKASTTKKLKRGTSNSSTTSTTHVAIEASSSITSSSTAAPVPDWCSDPTLFSTGEEEDESINPPMDLLDAASSGVVWTIGWQQFISNCRDEACVQYVFQRSGQWAANGLPLQ